MLMLPRPGYRPSYAPLLAKSAHQVLFRDLRVLTSASNVMINAALCGCGIFAKDVYAKQFAENSASVSLVKAWSRSSAAAEEFVAKFAPGAHAVHGDNGLEAIMQDPAIHLVVVVLPPKAALAVVKQALAAGKHVIEEKPVAATIGEAIDAIQAYRAKGARPLWMFAENYRYEPVFQDACKLGLGLLGTVVKLDLAVNMAMDQNNRYYGSQWRRDSDACQGGMLMESSVHFVAVLRMLAAACGLGEATHVTARTFHAKPDLSGPDSLVGTVAFKLGLAPASVSITLAASQVDWSLKAIGTEGCLEISRGGWTGSRAAYTLTWKSHSDAQPQVKSYPFVGVQNEFTSFIRLMQAENGVQSGSASLRGTTEESLGSPEEGARDLALVHALLESGANGGTITQVIPIS